MLFPCISNGFNQLFLCSFKWLSQYILTLIPIPLFLSRLHQRLCRCQLWVPTQHLRTKLEQLITQIGDVNLHLCHLYSRQGKQTGSFIRLLYLFGVIQNTAVALLIKTSWEKGINLQNYMLFIKSCGIEMEIKLWNMFAWSQKNWSTLIFTGWFDFSSPLLWPLSWLISH